MTYPEIDDGKRNRTIGIVGLFVLAYLVIMLILALICYLRSKRLKGREVTFDGPSTVTDPTETEHGKKESKKYKNGVEVMPSEAQKIKKEQKEKLIKKKAGGSGSTGAAKKKKKSTSAIKKSASTDKKADPTSINATVDKNDDSDEEQLDQDVSDEDEEK